MRRTVCRACAPNAVHAEFWNWLWRKKKCNLQEVKILLDFGMGFCGEPRCPGSRRGHVGGKRLVLLRLR